MEQVAEALKEFLENGHWKQEFLHVVEKIEISAYVKEDVNIDPNEILAVFNAIIRIYGSN